MRSCLRDSLLTIEISKERGDPLRLVEAAVDLRSKAEQRARRFRDDNLRYDQVWCVIDVDEHVRLEAAQILADRVGIYLAISNPWFELWPLLHLSDQFAYITQPGLQAALREHMPGYEKRLACERLRKNYALARERAQALQKRHVRNGRPPSWNPSTDVWVLVDALLEAARRSGARTGIQSFDL